MFAHFDSREEDRGMSWCKELPNCPNRFTLTKRRGVYERGIWGPLVQDEWRALLYCMTSISISQSGFQQRVSALMCHIYWLQGLILKKNGLSIFFIEMRHGPQKLLATRWVWRSWWSCNFYLWLQLVLPQVTDIKMNFIHLKFHGKFCHLWQHELRP